MLQEEADERPSRPILTCSYMPSEEREVKRSALNTSNANTYAPEE